MEAGLPLELGMLMAAVMRVRVKLGEGEGIRGRVSESLSNDMVSGKMQEASGAAVLMLHGAERELKEWRRRRGANGQ